MIRPRYNLALGTACALGLLSTSALAAPTIYSGGTIITMDGERPQRVEAVVVDDSEITFVGGLKRAEKIAGKGAGYRSLDGRTMLPGFIDAHSHFALAMQMAGGLNLDTLKGGPVADITSLGGAIRDYVSQHAIAKGAPVVVWQYDPERLTEKRHVTRAELDAMVPGHRVILIHISVHGIIASTEALRAAGIGETMKDVPGGVVGRNADGSLNGLLFETAMYPLLMALPRADTAQRRERMLAAEKMYLAEGYTHAQDGATQPDDLAYLTSEDARAHLKIDLALLPFGGNVDALLAQPGLAWGQYSGPVKVHGVKFVLDGSPQARTAYFTRDYKLGSPSGEHPWHGHPTVPADVFTASARKVHERGIPLFIHANGDAAIDVAIKTFDTLGIKSADDRRPVIIHSQFQRPDQLRDYARIGVSPSYFSNHTWYWSDIHRQNFPDTVVDFISPLRSAERAGLIASNHSDYSVTPLNTRMLLWSAVNRLSPSGRVVGAKERISTYAALQALTTGPAYQMREENRKGRIKAGLLADFVILDRDPLRTKNADLRDIKVLETIKRGQTVWRAN